ncbi:helix-turn-helix transcriptional regulator [Piscinibacter sakaiensis]|uniref:helix-turn-helix domain-containing protein n=1 Tax=Piscinibacter sakaiensis TaxID=1547922 RepID=UPI00372AE445
MRLRGLRMSRGLSPGEFAALAGVSQAQQYRLESGERVPDALYLVRLIVELGIDVRVVLDGAIPCRAAAPAPSSGAPA